MMHHMKRATVRDLRYQFPRVSRWLEEGETVEITLRGQPFATMVATKKKRASAKEWPDFAARRARLFPTGVLGKPLSEIVSEGRGDR